MAVIDPDQFLSPISEESPSGENLEYDAAFGELERVAAGKAQRQSGDEIIEAEPPQWRDVADQAAALLERTRDLRVTFYLTHAALNIDGFAGLAAGLRLTHGLLDTLWDSVHPQLDKDDNDDPTFRINSVSSLGGDNVIDSLRKVPLAASRVAGRFSLRDVRLASGELPAGEKDKVPEAALVDAAFADTDLAELTATDAAVKEAAATLDAIIKVLDTRAGSQAATPKVEDLQKELRAIQLVLKPQLEKRGVAVAAADGEAPGAGVAGSAGAAGPAAVGQIRTREDAVRVIDQVSDFFRKNEPSSPVPLLLQRAKRLVAKDFLEILRDLTPDGVSQAEAIGGITHSE
jgi:type VI secretion system protein ImpA